MALHVAQLLKQAKHQDHGCPALEVSLANELLTAGTSCIIDLLFNSSIGAVAPSLHVTWGRSLSVNNIKLHPQDWIFIQLASGTWLAKVKAVFQVKELHNLIFICFQVVDSISDYMNYQTNLTQDGPAWIIRNDILLQKMQQREPMLAPLSYCRIVKLHRNVRRTIQAAGDDSLKISSFYKIGALE